MHKSPHHLLHLHPREGGKGVKRRKIPPCNFPRLQSTNLLETNACSPHTHQVVKFHATRRSGPQRLANEVVNMIRPSGSRTFFRLQCQVREMKNEKEKKTVRSGVACVEISRTHRRESIQHRRGSRWCEQNVRPSSGKTFGTLKVRQNLQPLALADCCCCRCRLPPEDTLGYCPSAAHRKWTSSRDLTGRWAWPLHRYYHSSLVTRIHHPKVFCFLEN